MVFLGVKILTRASSIDSSTMVLTDSNEPGTLPCRDAPTLSQIFSATSVATFFVMRCPLNLAITGSRSFFSSGLADTRFLIMEKNPEEFAFGASLLFCSASCGSSSSLSTSQSRLVWPVSMGISGSCPLSWLEEDKSSLFNSSLEAEASSHLRPDFFGGGAGEVAVGAGFLGSLVEDLPRGPNPLALSFSMLDWTFEESSSLSALSDTSFLAEALSLSLLSSFVLEALSVCSNLRGPFSARSFFCRSDLDSTDSSIFTNISVNSRCCLVLIFTSSSVSL
mmetsp:Transcript_14817/g.20667  ORF Transcript_14817/g.20667 Transcript_14817/m.20667 type:complete len:279 (+) Transcript_14817:715-1551(+)